jgi:hypothetical protein
MMLYSSKIKRMDASQTIKGSVKLPYEENKYSEQLTIQNTTKKSLVERINLHKALKIPI